MAHYLIVAEAILCAMVLLWGLLVFAFYKALGDRSSELKPYTGRPIPDAVQRPIGSPFGHRSTAMDVIQDIDLTGKNIVMTGGHSSTGLEAAKAFAAAGASITVLARDPARAIGHLKHVPNVEVERVDLLDPASIDAFACNYVESGQALHILFNGAGIMATPFERDARGYERQFATNVLGHFQLTLRLLPALERAGGARIVNVASRGHHAGGVILDDINFERTPYTGMRAYAQTKSALILLSLYQDELWRSKKIRAYATTPGPVPTSDLFAAGSAGWGPRWKTLLGRGLASLLRMTPATTLMNWIRNPRNEGDIYKTVAQGGASGVWAATSPILDDLGGIYIEDCEIAPRVEDEPRAPYGVKSWAVDRDVARSLWQTCERMIAGTVKFETVDECPAR